ncbi:MAG TPA: cupin domain-containing protein [Gammaproteobacteria bacterium]|nr:cupin domain-containing protein [Gammaproteobacteria bacterium]
MLCRVNLLLSLILAWPVAGAQEPGNERRVLSRADLPTPGYEAVLVEARIPVGGREGRHRHPGTLVGYVQSGTITLEHEDRAPVVYEPGEAFDIEPGKVHEGINTGAVPVVVIAAFIVERGQPLATQAD